MNPLTKKTLVLLIVVFSGFTSYSQHFAQIAKISDSYNTYRDHSPIRYDPIKDYVQNKRIVAFGEA